MSSFYVLAPATPTITTSYVPHGMLTLQCFVFRLGYHDYCFIVFGKKRK